MYKYMPAYLQDLAVSFRGLTISRYRYGREFQEAYAAYLERGSWPEKKILEFREKQRAAALQRAAKAPFYSALFEKMGGVWQDFLDESAFRELPVITKADIQADNPGRYRSLSSKSTLANRRTDNDIRYYGDILNFASFTECRT